MANVKWEVISEVTFGETTQLLSFWFSLTFRKKKKDHLKDFYNQKYITRLYNYFNKLHVILYALQDEILF